MKDEIIGYIAIQSGQTVDLRIIRLSGLIHLEMYERDTSNMLFSLVMSPAEAHSVAGLLWNASSEKKDGSAGK
jgi:hypothetical protein